MAAQHADAYVLAADTVVAVGARILPKTHDEDAARRCLALLSGRAHRVFTAVCLVAPPDTPNAPSTHSLRIAQARVKVNRLHPDEIDAYIASGEWRGKAGGYAIQGQAARFIPWISGSYTAIVGLPLAQTVSLLKGAGYRPL